MKIIDHLRRILLCCTSSPIPTAAIKNRRTASCQQPDPSSQEDSLIDAAAAADMINTAAPSRPSSSRSTVVGTIFGRRRGHVSFCVQSDPSAPPPFLFELSVPTHVLAKEMGSGLLRIALDCCRRRSQWKAYCNGRHVGYALRRKPTNRDLAILKTVCSMSAGAGVLAVPDIDDDVDDENDEEEEELGEVLYLRASYERVVGSSDSVSYHLINPSPTHHHHHHHHHQQQLSVFLLRTA